MIIEVSEIDYIGFHLELAKGAGWKIVLQGVEYLFPTMQDAQAAVNEFLRDVIPKHKGKLIK